MMRLAETSAPRILLAVAACASDKSTSIADIAFPSEGPLSVVREDSGDFVDPRTDGGVYREAIVAFLRWQLHDDAVGALWFTGDNCVLCEDPSWSFDKR